MKKIAFVLLCLLAACLLLSACQTDHDTGDTESVTSLSSVSESDTSDTVFPKKAAEITTTAYQLLHVACPEGPKGIIKATDDVLSSERWYLGTFTSLDQTLPDVFADLFFDKTTTEEAYLSAFRVALSKVLPEENVPDRFSVSVSTRMECADGVSGRLFNHFESSETMDDVIFVKYIFRFFVTVSGWESDAAITVEVENFQVKSVELYDLSQFLRYQELTVDTESVMAFAEEAVWEEWKAYDAGAGKYRRIVLQSGYSVAVSDDALYLRVNSLVLSVNGFCARGIGYCNHYIKLS